MKRKRYVMPLWKIEQEAAYWATRIKPDSPPEEFRALDAWLNADPRHKREFVRIAMAWRWVDKLKAVLEPRSDAGRSPSLSEAFVEWVRASKLRSVLGPRSDAGRSPSLSEAFVQWVRASSPALRWWAVAVPFLVVLVLGGFYAQSAYLFGGEIVATRTGETRVVTFEEGSVAYLNTRTKLRWTGSETDRRVTLTEGEVLFDVVHDAAHPFRVDLDKSEIRVLGTRFTVYRKPDGDTTVTVLEGTVEVRGLAKPTWVRTLHASEQIEFRRTSLVREPYRADAQTAVDWRSRLYRFNDERVADVIDELLRYSDEHVTIRDPRVAERHISGSLRTDNLRRALANLQTKVPMEIREEPGGYVLDYRPAPPPPAAGTHE